MTRTSLHEFASYDADFACTVVGPEGHDLVIRESPMKPARVTELMRDHPCIVRTRLGLTQEEFSTMLGVPLSTLRNWEPSIRQDI
jgi:DNA-binding transcriptional regulator YiaG